MNETATAPRIEVAPQASGPNNYQMLILTALNFRHLAGKRMYLGTVPYDEVQRRRAKNRAAGKARRITRRSR